ncbi:Development/cell death domain [Macleaya cordata]|uniref:Development/cell death domain n=1 Tax=Macleaya cordata TaxID=56857 RepID=A0A200QCS3_MACCD|nr:Development/cell death domain [Macleaya cordata]
MENNQQSFWQFSDQLRLQSSNFANLSINDNIWGNSYTSKRPEERRNFDIRVGGERASSNNLKPKGSDLNGFNDGWKIGNSFGGIVGGTHQKNLSVNNGIYSKPGSNYNKNNKNKEDDQVNKSGKKSNNNNNKNKDENKNSVDKRFKTLPPTESLPRNEVVGGYIFVCNNDTMEENLKRQLFGLPPRYRDSVRAITPGLPLFLYNYSTHQLHGIFEAASFGGTNIDPSAWEDKKCPGESRFPAQVRVVTRKICDPLEEDSFRPILHHYDGPKFRLELNIPEALALLDIFSDESSKRSESFN